MGDRSNIFIQQDKGAEGWRGVGVYSHWGGESLFASAQHHATNALGRLGDPSYFTRYVIQNVCADQFEAGSLTGGGIWTVRPDDNEYSILVINAETGKAWYCGDQDFAKDAPADAVDVADLDPEAWRGSERV